MTKSNKYLKYIKKQAANNLQDGERFLTENAKSPTVEVMPSGLQYEVLEMGSGQRPSKQSRVLCHYKGTILDGTVFDGTHKAKRPAAFLVGELIKGWQEALVLMPVGSRWKLYIPPSLGYGFESLTEHSGGNCTLIFELELLAIL